MVAAAVSFPHLPVAIQCHCVCVKTHDEVFVAFSLTKTHIDDAVAAPDDRLDEPDTELVLKSTRLDQNVLKVSVQSMICKGRMQLRGYISQAVACSRRGHCSPIGVSLSLFL